MPRARDKIPQTARGLSVFLCIVTLLVIVGGLIWLVAPQLYSSLERFLVNSSDYIARADAWLTRMLQNYPEIESAVSSAFGDVSSGLVAWATNNLLPEFRSLIADVTLNLYYVARGVYNVIIGIIVSVYMLHSREAFSARCKKLIYCVFSLEAAEKILRGLNFTNQVFIGFLSGKIFDSLIVGIICYIGCLILKVPYALLISCLIGITNIIPFFGPVIGAIPACILILTESGWKMLAFLAFVIVLQQFDGNILGPKILGSRIGINGFWVMFAIILGAGIFGFTGMLLGVPVFVVFYSFFSKLVNRKLSRSGLPTDTAEYQRLYFFDPRTKRAVAVSTPPRRSGKNRKRTKDSSQEPPRADS